MGTEVINVSFDALQEELDKAKSNLKDLNENIRRISGREPPEQLSRGDRKRPLDRRLDRDRGSDYGQNESRNRLNSSRSSGGGGGVNVDRDRDRDSPPQSKRKAETKSVFSRLSGPPGLRDDDIKPKLNSRIIRELPTKEEIVEAQGSDPASRARNRRMFGSLLGTLQKFCQEESRLQQKEQKKAKIEKKLEEQEIQERETMKKERQSLFNNRKRQQLQIKMLENRMNLKKEFAQWEEAKKPLLNYIRTKTKPRIYYLPRILDKRTERRLEESKRDTEKQIEKRRAEVNEEMADIVNRFEASTELLQPLSDSNNDNTYIASLLDQSTADNHMDQSEDDSYYHRSFNSTVNKNNKNNNSNNSNNKNSSSNQRDGENRDRRDENADRSSDDDGGNENRSAADEVSIKIEKDDDHLHKNQANAGVTSKTHQSDEENDTKPNISRSPSQT